MFRPIFCTVLGSLPTILSEIRKLYDRLETGRYFDNFENKTIFRDKSKDRRFAPKTRIILFNCIVPESDASGDTQMGFHIYSRILISAC